MRKGTRSLLGAIVMSLVFSTSQPAAIAGGTPLTTELVTGGLVMPLFVTAPPGDFNRIFIVEQRSGTTGRIRVFDLTTSTLLGTPFLSVLNVSTGSEQGLLGLAFHPNYSVNGYFYVNYTDAVGDTHIVRYQASPPSSNVANAASASLVLFVDQPFANHNGGWLGFGPDGYLYAALGDGGSANDPGNRAQDITSQLLGKMLRIDVDGPDAYPGDGTRNYAIPASNPFVGVAGDDEIWAYGLRNPWRDAFDRETGDLWIGDVGQNAIEEINVQPGSSAGGENYGWRCYEGNNAFNTAGCAAPATMEFPIYTYSHAGTSCSVTGGYVYRGCAIPDLRGTYFFADYCSEQISSFVNVGGAVTQFQDRTAELDPPGAASIHNITSFGEDAQGELYICDQSGEVFRIIAATPVADDCEDGACCMGDGPCVVVPGNQCTRFVCNVADYLPPTFNGCLGDEDGNGVVNPGDRGVVSANDGQTAWSLICLADLDGNGLVNPGDRGFVSANIGLCTPLPDFQNGSGLNGGAPDFRYPPPTFLGVGTSCPTTCP